MLPWKTPGGTTFVRTACIKLASIPKKTDHSFKFGLASVSRNLYKSDLKMLVAGNPPRLVEEGRNSTNTLEYAKRGEHSKWNGFDFSFWHADCLKVRTA